MSLVPEQLPLFPLATVLFPGMILPLRIFEDRYRTLIARRAKADPMFGVVLTRRGREVGDRPEIHSVGTAASLLRAISYADGRSDIVVRGGRRFRVLAGHWQEGYLTGTVAWIEDGVVPSQAEEASLVVEVKDAFRAYLDAVEATSSLRIERTDLGTDPLAVTYAICSAMPFDTARRQRLLEATTPAARLLDLIATLRRERALMLATGIGGAAIDHPGTRFATN